MKKIHFLFTALITCLSLFTACQKEEFIVTFNPNGGTGDLITQVFSQKVAQPLMANFFTKSGHTFAGWNTAADGTGTDYGDQELVQISGHMVLYAQWTIMSGEFTVTFDANGGEGNMDQQKFNAGTRQQLLANKFFRNDFLFVGWNTNKDGRGEKFTNQQEILVSSDMTLFAQWSAPTVPISYFVYFNANGGNGTMEQQEFIENEPQKLAVNTFEPADTVLMFAGWNTNENGSGIKYSDMEEIIINANMRLYAQWDSITPRILHYTKIN